MVLEKMDAFFETRLEGYDEHMLRDISFAKEFYPFTAALLPAEPGAYILDLGCGTGLELEFYFRRNPEARIKGIDLSRGMLDVLESKFADMAIEAVQGSYFEVPLGECVFDGAVSVESLHHFTPEEKLPLYRKLYAALKPGSSFVLTDYFAESEWEAQLYRATLETLKREQGIADSDFYHYDTPLTAAKEKQLLEEAGFAVETAGKWEATSTLIAKK